MKTRKLQFAKTLDPCTYAQVEKMRSFDGFRTQFSNSQIMKRLSMGDASEIISLLVDGEEIELV
jgi:hypothetical protein